MDNTEFLENYLATNGITYSISDTNYLINSQYVFTKVFINEADQQWLLRELEVVKNKI